MQPRRAMRASSLVLVVLACAPRCARAGQADASKPHAHTGIIKKYERVPPSAIGLGKLGVSDEELRRGEPTLKKMSLPGGFTRAVSIQDVHAPEKVIFSAINDLPNYPKYVDGVVKCAVYSKEKSMSGQTVVCSEYKLKSHGVSLTYFMRHIYEPKKHCMTFHLDYERCSDLSDSVGYWYVEDLKDGWCRVYYSTDSQLPAFVPGMLKDVLTKIGLKRSTSWVAERCNELTGYRPGEGEGGAVSTAGGGASLTKLLRKVLLVAMLAGAWQLKMAL